MGLLVTDKWDTYYIPGHEEDAALTLLNERVDQGFWYDERTIPTLNEIISYRRGDEALTFLLSRCDYEYELVEVKDNG